MNKFEMVSGTMEENATETLEEFLKVSGLSEEGALSILKRSFDKERSEYYKVMRDTNIKNKMGRKRLLQLIVNNRRDKGDWESFFEHHSNLGAASEVIHPLPF